VAKEIYLEINFYCFSNEIFDNEFPYELESEWESIYQQYDDVEKQVIFPCIDKEIHNLADFVHL